MIGMDIYVPGFVRIDEIRQIGDTAQVEAYVQYDDTNLTEVYQVTVTFNPDAPISNPDWTPMGKIFLQTGQFAYVYFYKYLLPPVPPGPHENTLRVMKVSGDIWNLEAVIPGFVRVDQFRRIGELDSVKYEFAVVIDTALRDDLYRFKPSLALADPNINPGEQILGVAEQSSGLAYMKLVVEPIPPVS
ncbi:hypothetical protein [Nocardia sp. R6R-6]|uniref:hypothetical protein n=1 Tax=Nocardia sp. R6R-6 TaxID=3459303 RepID=UPI00403D56D7